MEGLTLENFWNDIKEKYPRAHEKFTTWIDMIKRGPEWEVIKPGIKFHELPLEFQLGVIMRFYIEECNRLPNFEGNYPDRNAIIEDINAEFSLIQTGIVRSEQRERLSEYGGIDPDKLLTGW